MRLRVVTELSGGGVGTSVARMQSLWVSVASRVLAVCASASFPVYSRFTSLRTYPLIELVKENRPKFILPESVFALKDYFGCIMLHP